MANRIKDLRELAGRARPTNFMANVEKKKIKLQEMLLQAQKDFQKALQRKENGVAEKALDFQRKIAKLQEQLRQL